MNHCYFSFTNASYANSAPSDQNLASFSFIMFPFPAAATFQLQMTIYPQSKARRENCGATRPGTGGREKRRVNVCRTGMLDVAIQISRASCFVCCF